MKTMNKTLLTGIGLLLAMATASQAAMFHTDFTEAALGGITGLNKDAPGATS